MTFKKYRLSISLLIILLLGAYFRFTGLDWDQNHHLQPDERYISMVLSSLSPPPSLSNYLDPNQSTLSPYIHGFGAYIYGQLPLTIITYVSHWIGYNNDYYKTYLLGRGLSAFLDTLSIFLIFLLGKKLWNQKIGIFAAAFYAFAPLAIQYSHFMVMESWLTFFWLITLLLVLVPFQINAYRSALGYLIIITAGIAFGASLATKASSILLLPLLTLLTCIHAFSDGPGIFANKNSAGTPEPASNRSMSRTRIVLKRRMLRCGGQILIFTITSILAFRFLQPTIFASPSWFNWSLRSDFYQAFNFQQIAISGKVMFPPQWQWMNISRWWFPFKNIFLFGLGPTTSILAVIGIFFAILRGLSRAKSKDNPQKVLFALFCLLAFFYQGSKFVKTMRYFLPFFPFYCLFASYSLAQIQSIFSRIFSDEPGFFRWKNPLVRPNPPLSRSSSRERIVPKRLEVRLGGLIINLFFLLPPALFSLMFIQIYQRPTTRVAASQWIYQNIPANSAVMLEEWDDPLPLGLPNQPPIAYHTFMAPVYAPDNDQKKILIADWLSKSDWIILSSYRAKGSIGRLSDKFPLMSRFYRDLESGKLGFMKTAEFVSEPAFQISNFKFQINTSSSEEVFWVYDHPQVEIYKKI